MAPEGSREVGQLEARLRLRDRQIEAVHALAAALGSRTALGDLIQQTLRVCVDIVGAAAGAVILHDPQRGKLVFRYVVLEASAGLLGFEMSPDEGIAGLVFATGRTHITDDAAEEAHHRADVGQRVSLTTRDMVTVPLKDHVGRPIGVMQILNKVDGKLNPDDCALLEIVAAQASVVLENARLAEEARLAEVAHRLGDISHAIKNMLTPVQGGAQTLQAVIESMLGEVDAALADSATTRDELVVQLRHALDTLRETHSPMTDMILAGSAQVEARVREIADCVKGIVAEPRFEWADAAAIARQVTQYLEMDARKAGVTLVVEAPEDLPPIPLDASRARDAIYNLVHNAIPETPRDGRITIRLSVCAEGRFPDGDCLVLEVRDTGQGMPEEIRSRLFGNDVRTTKPGGTGLGTRIVKNAVDAHGGTIGVASELGVGSTFTIRLPLERRGMPARPA